MGLFDWFKKPSPSEPQPTVSLPQLCYDVAYFVLPHYVFHDIEKIADLCLNSPAAAGPFFYLMACQLRKIEPQIDAARQLHWHQGQFDDDREYFVLEFPVPPPVDLSSVPIEDLARGTKPIVLAPHFAAVIRARSSDDEASYFILGQAPIGSGTTLRSIMPDGANCNLGPGPEPRLAAFLAALSESHGR